MHTVHMPVTVHGGGIKASKNQRHRLCPRCCHLDSYLKRPKSSPVCLLACNWYYCAQLTAKPKAACALRFRWAVTSSNLGSLCYTNSVPCTNKMLLDRRPKLSLSWLYNHWKTIQINKHMPRDTNTKNKQKRNKINHVFHRNKHWLPI